MENLFADATVELNLPHVVTGGLAFWPIRDHEKRLEAGSRS